MHLQLHRPMWLLVLAASPGLAAFVDFFFAGNNGNNTAIRKCGTMPYACDPPNMCSKDTNNQKWYCCAPGVSDSVCWTGSPTCDGEPRTSPLSSPASDQIACTGGTTKYCCLKETERCTQTTNQFNICWSTQDNALRPLNATRLNETFSSLSRASPSAASYTINSQALRQLTSTTPGSSSATPTPSSSRASSTSSTSASATAAGGGGGGGLSGGAIGGIVGGVIGGLAIIALAAFLLWRRRKNTTGKIAPHAQAGDPYQGYGYQPTYQTQPQSPYSPPLGMADANAPLTDKYAHTHELGPVEAPAYNHPVEMDANYTQQHVSAK